MLPDSVNGWVAYIQTLHSRSIDLSLDRVSEVRDRLQLNPLNCHSISVAGTNGKGSTVAMLESVYGSAGYRTASYTSPHLVRYNERIRVDSKPVADEGLLPAFRAVEQARGSTPLTFFEFGTLVAAYVINCEGVDIALLEVGLGGRLDAVKVLSSDLAVITSIGIDHEAWLGPDRETIGREKAGIMHPGGDAICAESRCPESIVEEAKKHAVDLWRINFDFGFDRLDVDNSWGNHGDNNPTDDNQSGDGSWRWWCKHEGETAFSVLPAPGLAGSHQYFNAAAVVAAVQRLQSKLPVSEQNLISGLRSVSLPGRLQLVGESPMRIVDVAHNVEAVLELRAFLDANRVSGDTYAVLGMLEDKPVAECLDELLPVVNKWNLVSLDVERGLLADELLTIVTSRSMNAVTRCFNDPVEAWKSASASAGPEDRIVAFGSFHTVGDILDYLQANESAER